MNTQPCCPHAEAFTTRLDRLESDMKETQTKGDATATTVGELKSWIRGAVFMAMTVGAVVNWLLAHLGK